MIRILFFKNKKELVKIIFKECYVSSEKQAGSFTLSHFVV